MSTDIAMQPARILIRPQGDRFQDWCRRWQGSPSIELSPKGKIFVSMVTGQEAEQPGNFILVCASTDAGKTFRSPEVVVEHPDPACRTSNGVLWSDPRGRLWIFWVQTLKWNDGRLGVWTSLCDDPDAEEPVWSPPRRIANGTMSQKPTVLANGDWLFPCALWRDGCGVKDYKVRPGLEQEQFSNVFISSDEGKTISLRGSADIPNRQFDEHIIVQKQDGSLWILARTFDGIGESFSYDEGRTWSPGRKSAIPGPCSRFDIRRLRSGRLLMVNHHGFGPTISEAEVNAQDTPIKSWKGRDNLTALLSEDDGATWAHTLLLDQRDDVSYPHIREGDDGYLYVAYDYKRVTHREILIARFSEEDILKGWVESERGCLRILASKATGQPDVADKN